MELNRLFYESCRVYSQPTYYNPGKNITLIDNFFEDFTKSKIFLTSRNKWKAHACQANSKPGFESILPKWCGVFLLEKYIIDNKINDDINSYDITCNFLYKENINYDKNNVQNKVKNLMSYNVDLIPHIDGIISDDGCLEQICLVNLNDVEITTKFYEFMGKECISAEDNIQWQRFLSYLTNISSKHKNIRSFLERNYKNFPYKLKKVVTFKPNQAIIYPSNVLHTAHIEDHFSFENMRSTLRVTFDQKVQ